jgi:hypothetical protein
MLAGFTANVQPSLNIIYLSADSVAARVLILFRGVAEAGEVWMCSLGV